MYPILKAFDFIQMEEAYPGSALFVEFFESEGKDRVRLLYKRDAQQQEILLSTGRNKDYIDLDRFRAILQINLKQWQADHQSS